MIADLLPDGPGAKAGLKAGDVILAIDEKELTDSRAFYQQLWSRPAGETVLFRVFRNNVVQSIPIISGNVEEFFG